MATIPERLSTIEAQIKENGDDIKKLTNAIYGNGKPGLFTELALLRQSVEEHHESVEKLKNKNVGFWQWFITSLIALSGIIVTAINLFKG